MNIEVFNKKAHTYLHELQTNLQAASYSIKSHWNIDHICYRTSSMDQYLKLKKEFSLFSQDLIESDINGRPITTFKLFEPLKFNDRSFDLLELPAPKPNKNTAEGFEHIEVVCDQSFSDLKIELSNFEFKESGLKKYFNPELCVNINGSNIKFHHISLESVVNLEANTTVFKAISECNILSAFQGNSPKVVGTYPLNIYTKNSDVDIILETEDLNKTSDSLIKFCEGFEQPRQDSGETDDGQSYFLMKFNFNNIPFEIFVQNMATEKQRAFKHFQTEERLLKVGGPKFKSKVTELRSQGMKTEPAFAAALDLEGDPYLALLELHKLSENQLRSALVN